MFTKEIQEHVSFELNIDQMKILPATAEILHSGIAIGQIRKAGFGPGRRAVRFEPYIASLELHLRSSPFIRPQIGRRKSS